MIDNYNKTTLTMLYPVVKLEDLYDLNDRFKSSTNSKLQSSTLNYELINLGTNAKPQNINLGLGLAPEEKLAYIRLLRQYKNVFAWNYDELKTYDTSIIQHTIPMIDNEKPVQQTLRKIHPNLVNQIKNELNNLLKARKISPSDIPNGSPIWYMLERKAEILESTSIFGISTKPVKKTI